MVSRGVILALMIGLPAPFGSVLAQAPRERSSAPPVLPSDPFRNALYQAWEQPRQPGKPTATMLNLEFNPAPVPLGATAAGAADAPVSADFVGRAPRETSATTAAAGTIAPGEPRPRDAAGPQTRPFSPATPRAPAETRPNTGPAVAPVASPAQDKPAIRVEPLALERIPPSAAGRKAMSRQWLKDARAHLAAGRVDQAEAIADHLSELAVEYGRFEDNPRDLARDIAKARQKDATALLPSSARSTR